MTQKKPRVVLVYDWLTNMGGGEKLLLAMHRAFPEAPIYTSVYIPEACPDFKNADVHTTYLQHLPKFLRRWHQLFPVFRAHAFRRLTLPPCDIVISIASAEAKAVHVPAGAKHICYCFTPVRYYWSHYRDYKKDPGFGPLNPLIRLVIPPFVRFMRRWDLESVRRVDQFIANSTVVARRIKKYYGRTAAVIFPPVEMQLFRNLDISQPRSGFAVVGRQVPYKRVDLAITACNQLKLPLIISSNTVSGAEHERLKAMAGPTIVFTNATDAEKARLLAGAEAFLFPQEEDFGIVQIEALAAGTPVIAYAKGGALDVVQEGKTGVLFTEQTTASLVDAIKRFKKITFDHEAIKQYSQQFSEERFMQQVRDYVAKVISA